MKIVHVMLCGPVTDGWQYQDNLLTKYHKKIGNEVTMITSKWIAEKDGNLKKFQYSNYFNDDGVKVIRLSIKHDKHFFNKFKKFKGLAENIEKERPNILFIHGCQFLDIKQIMKYLKKYPNTKVYIDNHADFINSGTNWLSKNILHKIIWRSLVHKIEPYVTTFYGVTPARVDFLKKIYKLPSDKCQLLVMGVDPEIVQNISKQNCKAKIQKKYNIADSDFLIVTGGKIDHFKTQTLLLMDAINKIENKNIKLLIFGSVSLELKEEFESKCNSKKIIYVGWLETSESYKYIAAADLVIFPGAHSVLWEQTVGQGIPLLCRYFKGFEHVDVGGNVVFLYKDTIEEMYEKVLEIINNKDKYNAMKKIAQTKGLKLFSYKEIAKQSIKN